MMKNIKNIDEKIETLTAISSNKNIGKEKINSIKQKIRDLENSKKSIKYGKDSAITKSFKEYNAALRASLKKQSCNSNWNYSFVINNSDFKFH